eukprot:TRINITY_DN12434_c0_g5_i1.p1 TRINITY_DN12434_c0_g5~~TRINITY_DN12434_c0_g5_i1.p1  ORF type:complete len:202 (+),score=24.97 TRINITY_DN12434_c0_g5_i1:144-749(+)
MAAAAAAVWQNDAQLTWLDWSLEYEVPNDDQLRAPSPYEVPLPAMLWEMDDLPELASVDQSLVQSCHRQTHCEQVLLEKKSRYMVARPSKVECQLEKTRMCTFFAKGKCTFGPMCRFAHSALEIRHVPNLSKTKLCKKFERSACLDQGCKYAHGVADLRATPGLYKTALCMAATKGTCKRGDLCRFAHSFEELRSATEATH